MKAYIFFIFLFLSSFAAPCQEKQIKNLVFEGAGLRGIAYCGAIRELENKGVLSNIERVGGTSSGAITALCISLGYTSQEIADLLYATNFKKFNDGRYFFAGGLHRVNKYFGWYRGKRMIHWLEKIISKKTGDENITFEELYQKGFKDLYVTATAMNQQKLIVLSRKTYPAMQVKDAVRVSMSIPFYFEAPFIDTSGQMITRPRDKQGLELMVDGGLIGNFPIHIFDSVEITEAKKIYFANPATLGFRIDNDTQIKNDRQSRELAHMTVNNLKEYTAAFYNMVIENLNRQSLSSDDWKRTVSISDGAIKPRIRRLSKTEITTLIENGAGATKEFFSIK